MTRRRRRWAATAMGAALGGSVLAGCGGAGALPPAAEPAKAPALTARPVGTVVSLGAGTQPEGIVADPTTGLVAVGQRAPEALDLIDETGRKVAQVLLPTGPRHLALAGPGGPVLVPSEGSRRLVEVSLQTRAITAEIPTDAHPHDVAAAGGHLFVANEFGNDVSVVSGTRVVKVIPVPQQPGGIAAVGDKVAEISVRARKMAVIDANTLRTVAVVPAGVGPTHDVGYLGRFYVVDTEGGALLTFSSGPGVSQIGHVPLTGAPYGMALDQAHQRLWVTLTATNRLVAFDLSSGTPRLVASLPTVRQPNTVAVDSATGAVFVTGTSAGVVQVIPPSAQALGP